MPGFGLGKWAALAASVSIVLPGLAFAASARPDLTGVWTNYGQRNVTTGSRNPECDR